MTRTRSVTLTLVLLSAAVVAPAVGQGAFDCPSLGEMLNNLDRHYDQRRVFGSGAEVIAGAKQFKPGDIYQLGSYFLDGERGLPRDGHLGLCLVYRNLQNGHAPSALAVAEKYQELQMPVEAVKHYGIVFGYWRVSEALQIRAGLTDPWKPDIAFSHLVFASARKLMQAPGADKVKLRKAFRDGMQMGAGMTSDLRFYQQLYDR